MEACSYYWEEDTECEWLRCVPKPVPPSGLNAMEVIGLVFLCLILTGMTFVATILSKLLWCPKLLLCYFLHEAFFISVSAIRRYRPNVYERMRGILSCT